MRCLALLLLIAFLPLSVSAHMLKTDRDVGVLMHIDPNDAPVEREKATLFLEIKDRSNRFVPGQCDCRVRISSGGRQVFENPVFAPGLQSSAASFVFPEAGVYRVEIGGVPAKGGDFQSFSIPFDVRVERSDRVESEGENALRRYWPVWTVLVLALAGFLYAAFKMTRKVKK
jgi:hypothetical protein